MPVNANDVPVLLSNAALLLISHVLVVLLSINTTILLDVLEGKVHKTTMAAMILGSVTVYQLLLAQRE